MKPVEAPVRRIATLGFAPAPRVNVVRSMSFTDIDTDTGQRSYMAVTGRRLIRSQEDVFQALLKMSLLELGHTLKIDLRSPPAWYPTPDEALDAHIKLTSGNLFEALVAEIEEEEIDLPLAHAREVEPMSDIRLGRALPVILTEIGLAYEDVDRRGGTQDAFIDPSESDRTVIVDHVVRSVTEHNDAIKDLFDIGDFELAHTKISARFLGDDEPAEPMEPIGDLGLATTIAWATNLAASSNETVDITTDRRIGFSLLGRDARQISGTRSIDIVRDEGRGIRMDLKLGERLGMEELSRMNAALEKLSRLWPAMAMA